MPGRCRSSSRSSWRSAHSARADGLAMVLAGGRGYGGDRRRPVTGAAMRGSSRRWSRPSAARIEKRVLRRYSQTRAPGT